MADEWECLQRQVDELEALQSVFPERGAVEMAAAEEAALRFAQHLLEHVRLAGAGAADRGGSLASPHDVGSLSGTVWLPEVQVCGSRVGLRFLLPAAYPTAAAPQLSVQCGGPRPVHEALSAAVQASVDEALGAECLVLASHALLEAATASSSDNPTEHADHALLAPASGRSASVLALLIWFHHIKSLEKRKRMVEWARELRLAGGCKPGFPGVVVVEGAEDDVREFVARVRSMPWQAMQVRGEDLLRASASGDGDGSAACPTAPPMRRLYGPSGPWVFCEYEEEGGLGQLGAVCKSAGLEELFMTALKL